MEGACPRCGADAVEFDLVAGISACEACGAVLSDEQLVHGGGPQALGGTFVGAADTGAAVALGCCCLKHSQLPWDRC